MQTKFKRHQKVKLLRDPNPEYVEFNLEDDENDEVKQSSHPAIEKGSQGKINILLPNGQYHVEILDDEGNTLAYVAMNEEDLESSENAEEGQSAED
ncbi:MAG: hypothetical protein Q8Q31_04845 [Nanoarchaeota archaeon]|nr:hypothetical protein [Nanoarchaeota archaeon]